MSTIKKHYYKPKLIIDELKAALFVANEELKLKNDELIRVHREKNEMFANISHDLRSPITAIRSAIEYVSSVDSIDKEELNQIFGLITTRIINLENLINDIFLITTLENRSIELKKELVQIGPILEEYFFSCEVDLKYRDRQLQIEVPEDFSCQVSIDTARIIRVLDNLFTNALKYSMSGANIVLGAKKTNREIIIWVKDSGIGIAKEFCDRVFERCFTVSVARTPKSSSGCGLGLSIAKLIVERHEGKIWCESDYGKGSTFYFTLPIVYEI